jgi:curved DNA-binding protein CbpA
MMLSSYTKAQSAIRRLSFPRGYFTNTESMKRDDPYAQLGLTWGATTTEIKEAYKQKARELHPDVNKNDSPQLALKKFQRMKLAFEKLMDVRGASHRDDLAEEWSFAVWRNADIMAQDRDDVAGAIRKRPAKPAVSILNNKWGVAALGHPDGGGNARRRGEFISDGKGSKSNTVGTGKSKWVDANQKYKPWSPPSEIKRAGKAQMEFKSGSGVDKR